MYVPDIFPDKSGSSFKLLLFGIPEKQFFSDRIREDGLGFERILFERLPRPNLKNDDITAFLLLQHADECISCKSQGEPCQEMYCEW